MSDRTKIAAEAKNIMFVPLGKLKKSPKNVRKVPHTKADIKALAASIAALGMLQDRRDQPVGVEARRQHRSALERLGVGGGGEEGVHHRVIPWRRRLLDCIWASP